MIDDKYHSKIVTPKDLAKILGPRPREQKAVMCHGTFDVVHPGHVRHLIYAKGLGDILIASLTSDAHILKADFRPFVPESLRALNLAALDMVDYVVIDDNANPLENLAIIMPDYFAKGYEYFADGLHPKTAEEKEVIETYGGEVIFTPGDIVYSSSSLIELGAPDIAVDKLYALMSAENISFDSLRDCFRRFPDISMHVIGDTIVDTYTETTMIGGQTKTPTLSVRYEGARRYVGGGGVVAKHLRAAGAQVTFTTVLGDDPLRQYVIDDLVEADVIVNEIVDATRPTTEKNAITCAGYRMLKIDTVDNRPVSDGVRAQVAEKISSTLAHGVVFSDFRHGMFNRETIPDLTAAIPDGVFRVADSQVASRWGNILEFQGFDLITPNEREARFSLGDQDSVIRPLALRLFEASQCKNLILKLGARGLMAYRQRDDLDDLRSFFIVDSFAKNVVDAVGAGDALLAYATLAEIASRDTVVSAIIGALAAACECECDGNVPVSPNDLLKKIDSIERLVKYEGYDE